MDSQQPQPADKPSRTSTQPDDYFENGLLVYTVAHHVKRGHCCGSGCRHCPYEPRHVDECSHMNEWLAFGIVTGIYGLLAALTLWAGSEGEDQQPPDTRAAP